MFTPLEMVAGVVLLIALGWEYVLLARSNATYFRYGLVCYSASVCPDPEEDDTEEGAVPSSRSGAQRSRILRLLEGPGQVPASRDPHRSWRIRHLDPTTFALTPRTNPFLFRAILTIDSGADLTAFVPWSIVVVAGPLALVATRAPFLCGSLVLAGLFGLGWFYHSLDRLLYTTLEPEFGGQSGAQPS